MIIVELFTVALLEGILVHQVVTLSAISTSSVPLHGVLGLHIVYTELGHFSHVGGRDAASRLIRASESATVQIIVLILASWAARVPTNLVRLVHLPLVGVCWAVSAVFVGRAEVLRPVEIYLIRKFVVELVVVFRRFIVSRELLGAALFTFGVVFASILWHRALDAVLRAHLILRLLNARGPDDGWLLYLIRRIVFVLVVVLIICRYPHDAA